MNHLAHLLAVAALVGCSGLTEGEAGIVGIEVTAPSETSIEVGETVQLTARVLNQNGDSVPATIEWRTPDTTISVESTTGLVSGVATGTGRVQAVSGSFSSALITFSVVSPAPASTTALPPPESVRRPR